MIIHDNGRSLKFKLAKKQLTLGAWLTIGNEMIAEMLAKMDFDWVVVDMEHSAITLEVAQRLVRTIELAGCNSLVRVGVNDANLIKRVMDTGAQGVIVPMVNTREEAQRAIDAVYYPPQGKRGVGLARAQGYGINFKNYKENLKKEAIVIVQIEHIEAVNNLEDILSLSGIDGFVVGPYDLSGSMGFPGEFDRPEFKQKIQYIMKVAKKFNCVAGVHVIPPSEQEVNAFIRKGYQFVALSLDTLVFQAAYGTLLNKVRSKNKK